MVASEQDLQAMKERDGAYVPQRRCSDDAYLAENAVVAKLVVDPENKVPVRAAVSVRG